MKWSNSITCSCFLGTSWSCQIPSPTCGLKKKILQKRMQLNQNLNQLSKKQISHFYESYQCDCHHIFNVISDVTFIQSPVRKELKNMGVPWHIFHSADASQPPIFSRCCFKAFSKILNGMSNEAWRRTFGLLSSMKKLQDFSQLFWASSNSKLTVDKHTVCVNKFWMGNSVIIKSLKS